MREYNVSLLDEMQNIKAVNESLETEINIRSLPGMIPGCLEEHELAIALEAARNYKPAAGIADIRNSTGFPNRNLNTVEILTDCITLTQNGYSFKVWKYVPRKPFDAAARPALVYMHSGSFFAGGAFMCENACKFIAEKANCAVFNVDYSLAPEAPYPVAKNQCEATVVYIKENSSALNIDSSRIYLAAESCAACFAAAIAQKCGSIKGMFLLYPLVSLNIEAMPFEWKLSDFEVNEAQTKLIMPRLNLGRSDGQGSNEFMMQIGAMYLQHGEERKDPEISPMHGKLETTCDTLVITAEYDGLRPQGEYFAKMLMDAGVNSEVIRYRGVHHAFVDKLGFIPQAEDALLEISKRIR